jgi:hypothetical protein
MRQYQRVIHGVALLLAVSACSSNDNKGVAPVGDFNNPIGLAGAAGNTGDLNRCVEGQANTTRVTPRVVLVLDGSCSMSTDYPANGSASVNACVENPKGRWAALRNALVDPQRGVVPKLQGVVQFGVAVFGGTQLACPIQGDPVRPALNTLAMLQAKMPTVQPGMYTPTGPALDWVYENLIEAPRPDGNNGPQIVILATDGEPNSCDGGGGRNGVMTNYQPSIDAVKRGTKKGATTYVISLADSSGAFHDHLQQLANLGNPAANGSAKLYEPTSPQQLEADLQALVGGAVGCDIALNGVIPAGSECSGTVMLNGSTLGCNQPNGWKLLDERHIRLQGSACKTLTATNGMLEARFPCASGFSPD